MAFELTFIVGDENITVFDRFCTNICLFLMLLQRIHHNHNLQPIILLYIKIEQKLHKDIIFMTWPLHFIALCTDIFYKLITICKAVSRCEA